MDSVLTHVVRLCLLVGLIYCLRDPKIFFFNKFLLKLGLMTLLTYLKIILL